jgi:hypothetical protein
MLVFLLVYYSALITEAISVDFTRLHVVISQKLEYRMKETVSSFILVSCLTYSAVLKIETVCSSETSVDFDQITHYFIIEDRTLQTKRNL